MKRIKIGIIGMGYIGVSHIEACRRIGFVEVAAVADTNYELAKAKADEYYIPKCYATVDELLADPEIDAVHNCTPNFLHTEINKKIIASGKHIFSEKPLATSTKETDEMLSLLAEHPNTVAGVNFNYRMNPQLQEVKARIASGKSGKVLLAHGSYLQDWLLYETDYNWRIEPEVGGPSRCIADIGSHWMDSVQNTIGAKITEVFADLVIVFPTRKKATTQVETFAKASDDVEYEEVPVKTEDYGAVMVKFDNGASGVFYVSEVSAGRGCNLNFEIDCANESYAWNQERCDELWVGSRDGANHLELRNPNALTPKAKQFTYLAKGHPEGWNDAFKNNFTAFYSFIRDGKNMKTDKPDFATFEDAAYIVKLTEAILESSAKKEWIKIK